MKLIDNLKIRNIKTIRDYNNYYNNLTIDNLDIYLQHGVRNNLITPRIMFNILEFTVANINLISSTQLIIVLWATIKVQLLKIKREILQRNIPKPNSQAYYTDVFVNDTAENLINVTRFDIIFQQVLQNLQNLNIYDFYSLLWILISIYCNDQRILFSVFQTIHNLEIIPFSMIALVLKTMAKLLYYNENLITVFIERIPLRYVFEDPPSCMIVIYSCAALNYPPHQNLLYLLENIDQIYFKLEVEGRANLLWGFMVYENKNNEVDITPRILMDSIALYSKLGEDEERILGQERATNVARVERNREPERSSLDIINEAHRAYERNFSVQGSLAETSERSRAQPSSSSQPSFKIHTPSSLAPSNIQNPSVKLRTLIKLHQFIIYMNATPQINSKIISYLKLTLHKSALQANILERLRNHYLSHEFIDEYSIYGIYYDIAMILDHTKILLIEVDGPMHTRSDGGIYGSDVIKNKIAYIHGYDLIRISYLHQDKLFEDVNIAIDLIYHQYR